MTNTSNTSLMDPVLVHAYADNELDTTSALAAAREIEGSSVLKAEFARTEALRAAIRERVPPEELPSRLRSRIDSALGLTRTSSRPTWRALAASVVLALAVGSASTWLVSHQVPSDQPATALVDSHIRALMAAQPADVMSSDRHTVKPWFNGRLPTSPVVIDLASEGFSLIGGRVDVIATVPTPTVVYGRRKHVISLFATLDPADSEAVRTLQPVNGYNVVAWHKAGKSYWAVSDLNATELQLFAQKFQAAS
jgi:anti-sigma factor RsiW